MSLSSIRNCLRTSLKGILALNERQDTFLQSFVILYYSIGVWSQGCTPDSKSFSKQQLGYCVRCASCTSYSAPFKNYCDPNKYSVWAQLSCAQTLILSPCGTIFRTENGAGSTPAGRFSYLQYHKNIFSTFKVGYEVSFWRRTLHNN